MTKLEFFAACGEYLIDPSLALENAEICEALRERDDAAVIDILENDF